MRYKDKQNTVRRHSAFVRFMRFLLPAAAVAAIGVFAVSASPQQADPTFKDQFANLTDDQQDLRMENMRYSSAGNDGVPYEVRASAAQQDETQSGVINLENPDGIRIEGDEEINVQAKTGVYNQKENQVDLENDVKVTRHVAGKDFVMNSTNAKVDIDDKTIIAENGVNGVSSDGDAIKADKMIANSQTGATEFHGNVQMVINFDDDETDDDSPNDISESDDDTTPESKE